MWAEPTFISALCEAGLSGGHPLCTFGTKQRRRLLNRSFADSAPVRRAVFADGAPVRRAVLRGQRPRQKDKLRKHLSCTASTFSTRQHAITRGIPTQTDMLPRNSSASTNGEQIWLSTTVPSGSSAAHPAGLQ